MTGLQQAAFDQSLKEVLTAFRTMQQVAASLRPTIQQYSGPAASEMIDACDHVENIAVRIGWMDPDRQWVYDRPTRRHDADDPDLL